LIGELVTVKTGPPCIKKVVPCVIETASECVILNGSVPNFTVFFQLMVATFFLNLLTNFRRQMLALPSVLQRRRGSGRYGQSQRQHRTRSHEVFPRLFCW